MEYIVTRRYKKKGIGGYFNLPYGTVCAVENGVIKSPDGRVICYEHSESGYTYFRPNTEEGRRRQAMLDGLYDYYERGGGSVAEDFDLSKRKAGENTYWKHILRTMPIAELTAFYLARLGTLKF